MANLRNQQEQLEELVNRYLRNGNTDLSNGFVWANPPAEINDKDDRAELVAVHSTNKAELRDSFSFDVKNTQATNTALVEAVSNMVKLSVNYGKK